MSNLFKKTIILTLLFFVATAIYLVRNNEIRDDFLEKFGLASFGDFKIPEKIKIDMSKIDMDRIINLENSDNIEKEEVKEVVVFEENKDRNQADNDNLDRLENVLTLNQEKTLSLEDIKGQIDEIAVQIETIKKEVNILVAMNEIKEEINNLTEMAGEMNSECLSCNFLMQI